MSSSFSFASVAMLSEDQGLVSTVDSGREWIQTGNIAASSLIFCATGISDCGKKVFGCFHKTKDFGTCSKVYEILVDGFATQKVRKQAIDFLVLGEGRVFDLERSSMESLCAREVKRFVLVDLEAKGESLIQGEESTIAFVRMDFQGKSSPGIAFSSERDVKIVGPSRLVSEVEKPQERKSSSPGVPKEKSPKRTGRKSPHSWGTVYHNVPDTE